MVVGQAPTFTKQLLPTDTYEGKLVNDDVDEFDDYDFQTGEKTGYKVWKYYADVEIDGVEDVNRPGKVYTKRLFFKQSFHEKAGFPKFLRAIGVPYDEKTGDYDTTPAVGKAWITLAITEKPGRNGPTNSVDSYLKCKSRKATEHAALPQGAVDNDGWPVESAEAPF